MKTIKASSRSSFYCPVQPHERIKQRCAIALAGFPGAVTDKQSTAASAAIAAAREPVENPRRMALFAGAPGRAGAARQAFVGRFGVFGPDSSGCGRIGVDEGHDQTPEASAINTQSCNKGVTAIAPEQTAECGRTGVVRRTHEYLRQSTGQHVTLLHGQGT